MADAGVEEAALDARLLLEYACGTDRNALLVHGGRAVEEEKRLAYEELVEKRRLRIPLQQLTGVQEFMGLEFAVNSHVLIPRQDTEILVEEALRELHDGMRILDMCTGSGCILISLLHFSNGCSGIGADISPEALEVAGKNAARLLGTAENAEFLQSDLFDEIKGRFDIIVSNPPYIPTSVIGTLMPEVKEHEPLSALDGHEDGLFFYRRIASGSREYLEPGGRIYLEIGFDQAEWVMGLLREAGFCGVRTVKDYGGLDRVVTGVSPILD